MVNRFERVFLTVFFVPQVLYLGWGGPAPFR